MLKQISTYGAVILTTMVVIRAATMEKESPAEIRSLYERPTDRLYAEHNLNLRESYISLIPSPAPHLLAYFGKKPVDLSVQRKFVRNSHQQEQAEVTTYEELVINTASNTDEIALLEDAHDEDVLSLDRESTVTSNLSLLFPRQRINPKPSRN